MTPQTWEILKALTNVVDGIAERLVEDAQIELHYRDDIKKVQDTLFAVKMNTPAEWYNVRE